MELQRKNRLITERKMFDPRESMVFQNKNHVTRNLAS